MVKLLNAADQIESGIITDILEKHGIPSYRREKETGNYMNLYMGYSVFGEDIYVREEDFERALELTANFQEQAKKGEEEDSGGSPDFEEDAKAGAPFYRKRAFAARVILAVAGLAFLTAILLAALAQSGR